MMRLTFLMGVVAFSSPRGALAGFAVDDSSIRTAVTAWFDDRSGAEATYGHISTWNTRGVTDMSDLFCRYDYWGSCSYYNRGAGSFNEDIGAWDTSGATNMRSMFYAASDFNQDISGWSVDTVKDMSYMFSGASDFNQDISGWSVDTVKDMFYMFKGASAFNQDLGWCVDDDVRGLDDMSSGAFYGTPCRSTKWTSCGVVQGGCDTPLTGSVMVNWKLRSAVIAWLSDAAAAEATYGPVWNSTSATGAPDNSSLSHFSAMTRPSWLCRAVRNRHHHAIEQASRRWRGGRRDDSVRTRRKIFISTQVRPYFYVEDWGGDGHVIYEFRWRLQRGHQCVGYLWRHKHESHVRGCLSL